MGRILFLGLLFQACFPSSPETGVLEGQIAPRIEGVDLQGQERSTAGVEKPVLLVFWASWCLPCREEVPAVNALVETYGERVTILGINMGESRAIASRVSEELGMRYPSLLDAESSIASDWRVRTLPLGVVLDNKGRIQFRGHGLPPQPTVLLDGLL